jgi:hypothetical protein
MDLPYIRRSPNSPYFIDESGNPWLPIGHNEAVEWPSLRGLFADGNGEDSGPHESDGETLRHAQNYIRLMAEHGITCIRIMLEDCQFDNHYFENPVGRFNPKIIRFFDRLFEYCRHYGIRILLTPFDTYWMWLRFEHHPYFVGNGGPCPDRTQMLTNRDVREAIKSRLDFVISRWGADGAIFAWDLWNEIHPAYGGDHVESIIDFISEMSEFVKNAEQYLYGKRHLQTVSVFGPILERGYPKEQGGLIKDPRLAELIYDSPALDFANTHTYEEDTIDDPKDTVIPAIRMADITRISILYIRDGRPYFDSEHGPIHLFIDKKRMLEEEFDNEYFRHMTWAHFASGSAGSGMRWPNRQPHMLTLGMFRALKALREFMPLIDWNSFARKNITTDLRVSDRDVYACGCGDAQQAFLWCVRKAVSKKNGMIRPDGKPKTFSISVPGLSRGRYTVTQWDTKTGSVMLTQHLISDADFIRFEVSLIADVAIAIQKKHL